MDFYTLSAMYPGIVAVENPVGGLDCLICGKLKPYYFKFSEITEIEDKLGSSICLMYGIKASVEILDLLNLSFYCRECTESIVEAHKIICSIRELKLKFETIKRLSEQALTEAVQVTDLGTAAGYVLHHELRSKIYEELHTDDTLSPANSASVTSSRTREESEPVVANFEVVIGSGGSEVRKQETTETGKAKQTGGTKLIVEDDDDMLKDDNAFVLHPHEDDFQNEDFHFGYLQPDHEETTEQLVGRKEAGTQRGDDDSDQRVNPDEYAELKLKYNIKECYVKVKRIRTKLITEPIEPNEVGTYSCPFPECGKTFTSNVGVKNHSCSGHHGRSQEEIQNHPRKHVCPHCGKRFREPYALRAHIRVVHDKIYDFKCLICERLFSSNTNLKTHICRPGRVKGQKRPRSTVRPRPPDPLRHMCERCGKLFVNRIEMLDHIQSAHEKLRPYKCHLCEKSFIMNKLLKIHLSYHTEEGHLVLPKCTICSREFVSDQVLRVHMYQHTKEFQFRCEHCDYGCTSKSALRNHMFKHAPQKLFKCDECGAEFQHKVRLQSHLKARHGPEEERIKCGICGKVYGDVTSRNRHEMLHNVTDRSYLCNICGKTFRIPYDLRRHITTYHKDGAVKSKLKKPRKIGETAQEAQE